MELKCIPGYSLSGSSVITCVKDRNWQYDTAPECILGNESLSQTISLVNLAHAKLFTSFVRLEIVVETL